METRPESVEFIATPEQMEVCRQNFCRCTVKIELDPKDLNVSCLSIEIPANSGLSFNQIIAENIEADSIINQYLEHFLKDKKEIAEITVALIVLDYLRNILLTLDDPNFKFEQTIPATLIVQNYTLASEKIIELMNAV